MKKIFYLLLLTAITLQGQTTGVNKLKIAANPEKTTAPRVMVQETNGDVGYVAKSSIQTDISGKVDKVAGKGLSTEDYTTAEKTKLSGIASGAEVNVNADWNATSGDALIINKPTIPSIAGLATETFVNNGLSTKENTITAGTTSQYWRGDKTWQTFNKAAVGLGNVDNTSDAAKPISTATQAALNLKANLASPTFTGNVTASGFSVAAGGSNYLLANGTTTPYSSGVFDGQLSIVGSSYLPAYYEGATTISTQLNTISFGNSATKQFNIAYNDIQEQKTISIPNIIGGYGELVISKYVHNAISAVPRFANSKMLEMGHVWDTNVGVGISSSIESPFNPSYLFQLQLDSAAKPSTNTWTIASDSRLKENIQNYTKGLSAILSIRPVTYDYNGKAGFSKIKGNIGVIAQEVQNIVPEGVSTFSAKLNPTDTSETTLYNFNSHAITYILINAIKELNQKITDLQAEVQILKSK